MRPRARVLPLLLLGLLASVAPARAQAPRAEPRIELEVGSREAGFPPLLRAPEVLEDRALRDALASGLPLRFRLRVELWRKGFFDRLVEAQESEFALVQDPLAGTYQLDTGVGERRFGSLAAAQAALPAILRPTLRAESGRGRFYYLATLEVETLSLSDLAELRRWLRGEVRPAVEGEAPVSRAVERGVRRALVRIIGLPTRRYETRSRTFVIP